MKFSCDICDKQFEKKFNYVTHNNGMSLCKKDINCKTLYREHLTLQERSKEIEERSKEIEEQNKILLEQNNETNKKLEDYRERVKEELKDYYEMETKYELLSAQMDQVLQNQKNVNITNNIDIVINNPVTFENIKWDTTNLTYDNVFDNIPKSLTNIIKNQMTIDEEKGIYSYCCTDVSRNNYKMLTEDYTWKSDPGGLILFEKVLETYFKPELENILYEKFGNERPGSFTSSESLAFYVWSKFYDLFSKKDKIYKRFQEYMSKELYMSQEQRGQIKFKKEKNQTLNKTNLRILQEHIETSEENENNIEIEYIYNDNDTQISESISG
jgi:hypothetical protein